ncbi:isoprenyl transferase [Allosphingosinicella flava]|uniref:Isoprenyl transferase n=1 Tax=Allosphingosinicella flava TaxID=2771430 RepID=A0A7T2LML6_9SPHN|nr:isoprenyl transferase [Sphingosinicella flava]QPQ55720.1 isoprenyl transferase [Sphingosinicella flava]
MTAIPASAASRPDSGGASPSVPRHVAIIMDGNGRWAKKRGLPRAAGHKAGAESVRKVLKAAGEAGVQCLTLYAFSSENWRRPETEISDLMGLLRFYLKAELSALHKQGVRIKIIGDYKVFPEDIVKMLEDAMALTAGNDRLTLAVALNYGSRDEMARAARILAGQVAAGSMKADAITPEAVDNLLYTADLPPLDLLIRTSGECRLSNFLLWQAAYAEMLFVDTLWPDFGGEAFRGALDDFARRERRYGGL